MWESTRGFQQTKGEAYILYVIGYRNPPKGGQRREFAVFANKTQQNSVGFANKANLPLPLDMLTKCFSASGGFVPRLQTREVPLETADQVSDPRATLQARGSRSPWTNTFSIIRGLSLLKIMQTWNDKFYSFVSVHRKMFLTFYSLYTLSLSVSLTTCSQLLPENNSEFYLQTTFLTEENEDTFRQSLKHCFWTLSVCSEHQRFFTTKRSINRRLTYLLTCHLM